MNKTVTINISGIIFHIEEDAYDKLSKYLNTIKGYFTSNESGSEIIADIEARIAELLQAKVTPFKQVILMADVDEVINALGKPEEFVDGETTGATNSSKQSDTYTHHSGPVKRRLFRDPDEKAIGGVCSGVAHYFDIDVVWIRLATFLLIFFGGVSLWVYIILWIVIPEAKTTADRLAMRGEAINIDNISKKFKEEMDGVKSRAQNFGQNMNDGFQTHSRTILDRIADILGGLFRVVGRLIGAFLIFIGFMIMFGLMSTIFGFSIAGESAEFNDWINIIFIDRSHYWLAFIGGIIVVGVPAFMILYGGIKLLFKIKYSNRWLNIGAGLLWIIGFIMATYAGVKTGSDFGETSKFKESRVITTSAEVFTISAVREDQLITKYGIEELNFDDHSERHIGRDEYSIGVMNKKKVIVGFPELRVVSGSGDHIEVIINRKARGKEKRLAYERAKEIRYSYQLDSTGLVLDELFYLDGGQKFRVQEIEVIVKVPKGKTVYLDRSLKNVVYDVDNVTNTYDQDMLGRRWKMNARELECLDCEGLDTSRSDDFFEDEDGDKVKINKDGIEVKDKDGTHIKINEDGININSDKKNIHLEKKEK
jgi:phage shock protein PspC (stress-responsive transcriptional regulator)